MDPFHPTTPHVHTLAAGASTLIQINLGEGAQRLIFNSGSAPVFYSLGTANTVTADATAHIIPAGAMIGISLRSNDAYMAMYSASGATVYISAGEGE